MSYCLQVKSRTRLHQVIRAIVALIVFTHGLLSQTPLLAGTETLTDSRFFYPSVNTSGVYSAVSCAFYVQSSGEEFFEILDSKLGEWRADFRVFNPTASNTPPQAPSGTAPWHPQTDFPISTVVFDGGQACGEFTSSISCKVTLARITRLQNATSFEHSPDLEKAERNLISAASVALDEWDSSKGISAPEILVSCLGITMLSAAVFTGIALYKICHPDTTSQHPPQLQVLARVNNV